MCVQIHCLNSPENLGNHIYSMNYKSSINKAIDINVTGHRNVTQDSPRVRAVYDVCH